MKNIKMGTYTYNDELLNFYFGTDLSVADKARFVNAITGFIVDDESYNSVIKDLIFDFYLIKFFTDVDVAEFETSYNFFDDVEQFLGKTNIVDIVKANMEIGLLDELNKAVDLAIEYHTGIHPNHLNDALASLLSTLEKKINEVDLNSMMGMAQKLNGMGEEFNLENLVKAYINSDVHMNNLKEIAESKGE